MDWIIGLLLVGGIVFWLSRPKANIAPVPARPDVPSTPEYENYQDELERKPIEELDKDEQIIRRAHDAFMAERDRMSAEYSSNKAALSEDEKKLSKARNFISTRYLDHALPFVQEETRYWPSWSKLGESRWISPVTLSEVDGTTSGSSDINWVQFRADNGPLYRIEFERSRMPVDGDHEYGSMTLFVDGDTVLGMFVRRNWTHEWASWQFSMVEALKVGPWIEGFLAFYLRLRSIKEKASADRANEYVRQKAAKIDLGDNTTEI